MRQIRAVYHFAICSIRKNESDIVKMRFANTVVENRSRDFWYEVKQMKSNNASVSTKNSYDEEEKAERDRRKTSVIIHGVKESDLPMDREEEDLGVMVAMLHEMSCNDVTG